MANLLSTLGGAATVYQGALQGQDAEIARQRKKILEGREDEIYGRKTERADIEHKEFKRDIEEEAGAREAAAGKAVGATGDPGQPVEDTSGQPLRTLAAAGAPGGGTSEEAPAAPAGAPASGALWLQQAEAQRQYWIKKGRPDRAAKVMQDAINGAIAEREASYKFETLPQIDAIRKKGLSAQELEADQNFTALRRKAAESDAQVGALMWGHVLSGNKKAAIDAFNASSVTLPGVQVADIGQSADGKTVFLLDKTGAIAKDKQGRDLKYSRQLLDNMWRQTSSSTLKLGKGESLYQTRKGAAGELTAEPVITAPDPAERRAAATAATGDDRRWAETLNAARDDSHRYIKDALGLTTNALGQVMKPENMPLFERAQPIVEQELQKFRASGKRMDQVTASDIAKAALKQARDEMAREKAGAGPDNPNPNAPAGGGPSWRDVLQ